MENIENKEVENTILDLNPETIDFKIFNFLLELEKFGKKQAIDWKIYYNTNFNIINTKNQYIDILKKEDLEWFVWIDYVELETLLKINSITKEFLTKNKNLEKILKSETKMNSYNEVRKEVWILIKENWVKIFFKS